MDIHNRKHSFGVISACYHNTVLRLIEANAGKVGGTELYKQHKAGKFELLTADEVAEEMLLFLENTDSEGSVFRSNHASNYVPLAGTLNADTPRMIRQLRQAMEKRHYKPEGFRGL